MHSVRGVGAGVLAVAIAALGACSQEPPPSTATAAIPASVVQAGKELDIYRRLQQEKNYELAAPIGKEIVDKYPGSLAAKEVQETLADTAAKATAIATRRRLERLWSYQSSKESGGNQNTASIYSNDANADDRVRLVLRRHSAWGQSAYLFGSGKGFDCAGNCTIGVRYDDQPVKRLKGYLPETGEPALFISDDKAFLEKLGTTQTLSIDVIDKGRGPRTLVFDVGGYDATKFPPVAKK